MSVLFPPRNEAERAAARKRHQTRVRSARSRAMHAIVQNKPNTAELVGEYSAFLDSGERLRRLIPLLGRASPPTFWQCMMMWWSICDATWDSRDALLLLMSKNEAHAPRNAPGDTSEVTVYRGCSRDRIYGLSWTLDATIAEAFARGHRFIPVPDPVIAVARIARADVFMFVDGRKEHEVLVDPGRLKELRYDRFSPAPLSQAPQDLVAA